MLISLNYCRLNFWLFEQLVAWTIARGTTCSSSNDNIQWAFELFFLLILTIEFI